MTGFYMKHNIGLKWVKICYEDLFPSYRNQSKSTDWFLNKGKRLSLESLRNMGKSQRGLRLQINF